MSPFQRRIQGLTKRKYLPFKIENLPPQIENKELEGLVIQLKRFKYGINQGNKKEIVNKIVKGHLRLALNIASRWGYLFQNKIDDICGVAQLELIKATYRAITNLEDNNITYYLSTSIHGAIKNFVENDNVFNVPARTIRYYIDKGDPRVNKLPKEIYLFDHDTEENSENVNQGYGNQSSMVPEIISNEEKLIETQELIDKITNDYIEKRIIELRAEGYTYDEIGPQVGFCSSKICIIVQNIEKKFNSLYGS